VPRRSSLSARAIEFPAEGLHDGEIRLRLMADADLPAIVAACQDPEIPRWTRIPHPYGEADARGWLEQEAALRARGEQLGLVIVSADDDRLLGSVGVVRFDWTDERCELGYWVAHEARGRGVAHRAVRLVTAWIFDAVRIDRVEICAEPENTGSRRVAERAGFTFEGVLRSYMLNKGRRRDMAMYSRLRTDSADTDPGRRRATLRER
jgi:RimJ/RimL family protein N-acetyltransferase